MPPGTKVQALLDQIHSWFNKRHIVVRTLIVLVATGALSKVGEKIVDIVSDTFTWLINSISPDILQKFGSILLYRIEFSFPVLGILATALTIWLVIWLVRRWRIARRREEELALREVAEKRMRELQDEQHRKALELQRELRNRDAAQREQRKLDAQREAALKNQSPTLGEFKGSTNGLVIFHDDFQSVNGAWHMPFWRVSDANKGTIVRQVGYLEFDARPGQWPRQSNGAIVTINDLKEGSYYAIVAKVKKGRPNTTMTFQLWVHDTKENNNVTVPNSDFASVGAEYEDVVLLWQATHTRSMSIHLHCKEGEGSIIVKDVKVTYLGETVPLLRIG